MSDNCYHKRKIEQTKRKILALEDKLIYHVASLEKQRLKRRVLTK